MREDRALAKRLSLRARFLKALQKEIESRITPREGISTSVEVPLTVDAKQALSFATEEASRFGHKHVESEHIVLGLLRVEQSMAAGILNANGVTLSDFRQFLSMQEPGSLATPRRVAMPRDPQGAQIILQIF